MKNHLIATLLYLFISCGPCHNDYSNISSNFSELKQLNQILIDNLEMVNWENNPEIIAQKISTAKTLISVLKKEINLTEINRYNIDGNKNALGFAYKFGPKKNKGCYSYLLFAKDPKNLESFDSYEQFWECAGRKKINSNWSYSIINPDCNN